MAGEEGFDFAAKTKISFASKPLTGLKAAKAHWALSFESPITQQNKKAKRMVRLSYFG